MNYTNISNYLNLYKKNKKKKLNKLKSKVWYKYNSVTSLAELEKRLPSKHLYIGSNPIGCIN
jgi:hypothetical protein